MKICKTSLLTIEVGGGPPRHIFYSVGFGQRLEPRLRLCDADRVPRRVDDIAPDSPNNTIHLIASMVGSMRPNRTVQRNLYYFQAPGLFPGTNSTVLAPPNDRKRRSKQFNLNDLSKQYLLGTTAPYYSTQSIRNAGARSVIFLCPCPQHTSYKSTRDTSTHSSRSYELDMVIIHRRIS